MSGYNKSEGSVSTSILKELASEMRLLFLIPFAWVRSLYAARILLNGRWSCYMGFCVEHAVNNLFYKTQYLNIDRLGRTATSTTSGLGELSLRNWFHLSLVSSFIFSNAGAVTILGGTLVWAMSHLAWISQQDAGWVIVISLIMASSSMAYSMAFARMNYQILGWMWWPLALFFMESDQLALAAFAIFSIALGGLTPLVFMLPIVLVMAFWNNDLNLLLAIIPGVFYCAVQVIHSVGLSSYSDIFQKVGGLIGATPKTVRYRRTGRKTSKTFIYLCGVFLFSFGLMVYSADDFPVLPLVGLLMFVVNQTLIRIADIQSVLVVVVSLFFFEAMTGDPHILAGAAVWVVSNPFPSVLGINRTQRTGGLGSEISYRPFDHTRLEGKINALFEPVEEGERVLFAFDDPNNDYDRLFDGYRGVLELPLFVAALRRFHLFPDWWAVMESNHDESLQMWGRSVEDVKANCDRWGAKYALIYDVSQNDLSEEWLEHFEVLTLFNWNYQDAQILKEILNSKDDVHMRWFLLQRR